MSSERLAGLPRTLILTLRGRADEHARPDGLFRDPYAAEWMAQLPWEADQEAFYNWRPQTGMAIRAAHFDERTRLFLEARAALPGPPLVVELGAGLSSRYYRVAGSCPAAGRARWVELDLPQAIAARRELDAESDTHRFLAASLLDAGWLDALPPTPPHAVLLIAEAVLPFLPAVGVQTLFDRLRARFPGGTFLFDAAGHRWRSGAGAHFAAMGAPIRWTITHEDDLAAMGLALRHVWPLIALHAERWGALAESPSEAARMMGLLIEAGL